LNTPVHKKILYLAAALFLVYGCASTPPVEEIQMSLKPTKTVDNKQKITRVEEVIKKIEERNKTVEDSQEWLKEAYNSIKIKKLNDIPKEEYGNLKKYADNGRVYIIVHPAYYVFFQNTEILSSKKDAEVFPTENIVERFYKKRFIFDPPMKIMQQQEMLLKNFLELMSTEKKFIILILPRDYKDYLSYGYIKGLDEYARYINEATHATESMVYIESASYVQGNLLETDLNNLLALLEAVGAKTIMLGGGYVGKCLEDFYIDLIPKFGFDNLYLVPEITAISPLDLHEEWTNNLLTNDGRLNIKAATINLKQSNAYGVQRLQMKVKNLPFLFYRLKTK